MTDILQDQIKKPIENLISQNPLLFGAGMLAIGAASLLYAFYRSRTVNQHAYLQYNNVKQKTASSTEALISAINSNKPDLEQIQNLISNMTAEELNLTDSSHATPLYYAIKKSKEISMLIVDKFLKSNVPMNYLLPNGQSMLEKKGFAKKLLRVINAPFNEFGCSDVDTFPGNIKPGADVELIKKRTSNRTQRQKQAETQANLIQPFTGVFTRKSIEECAKLLNIAKAGACTTLALATADRLLKLFPNEHIKIMGHNGGHRGSHVFVVMNQKGNNWMFDEMKDLDQMENKFFEEYQDAFIVDPWLATLGWQDGIFDVYSYHQDKNTGHFLYNCDCYFDSKFEVTPKLRQRI